MSEVIIWECEHHKEYYSDWVDPSYRREHWHHIHGEQFDIEPEDACNPDITEYDVEELIEAYEDQRE